MDKLLLEIPSSFETQRLAVKKYSKGDGKDLFGLLEKNNNREFLKEHADEASEVRNEEEAEINVQKREAEWISRTRFVMGIWLREENELVGQIWIEPSKWEVPSFELGWFLDQAHQGKGIAAEAAKRSLEFLFENLQSHKVIVMTRDNNERSRKLAERLGFVKEGHLRECSIENGNRFGLYYYGMLREEYELTFQV